MIPIHEPLKIEFKGYLITTDRTLLQPLAIHQWLSQESYWSKHIPYETVKTAFDNSYVIGVLKDNEQVGYARFVTDYAVFAYLADVYVMDKHRAQGLAKEMMKILLNLNWVQGLRGIHLGTRDAQGLYRQFGFTEHENPERMMKISRPDIYGDHQNTCR